MPGVTMTMVAKAAGVSVSTVSHVINGTRPVAPETRRCVQEAMDRLGFTHRPVARSLAAGGTVTVGVAIPLSGNPFHQELLAGIEGEAQRQGLSVLVSDTAENPERERAVVANLVAHHCRGLLLAPSSGWSRGAAKVIREHQLPCVLVDRLHDDPVDQVGVENERSSATLVEHLAAKGHRRVGCISGRPGLTTSDERVAGYRAALQARDLPVRDELIVCGDSTDVGGRRAMRELLALPEPPTAVFVANDAMTMGAMRAMREAGARIPEDIALVCFDDPPWGDLLEPGLTAIAQPTFAMGARAVQLLTRRLADPDGPPQTLRLAGEISHRGSCGCVA
ncbi:MAG: LacI family DNA-binding transcriptional regulator [Mobilicoccus sp.]|nr:LacI family DNA-binding transcriptional regulator [Mobilicoccus sp.]